MKNLIPEEYLYKVYSSWLGKVIGVRLGSPVEGWSHEKIVDTYHYKHGYLVDYDVYAADDDLNGPMFFIRALQDCEEISAEKIGDTFLNYLCEYSGFFWWGGVGVSTEHTAYENLKNGIKAPVSGSIKQNGKAIAEQIGGQIFSDCWGYVAGYDPELAKKLATMASSVTHDGCGIEGGIFVAVAITLAMQKNDIHEVINETLNYLDKDQEYYKVAKDIIRFYEENSTDWHKCLEYIRDNYGYDKYPGVCHIIPNSALMIMAMCYGDNDFDKTLEMLNFSGWDTDCNCGNVGSIMGALLGLEGINEKWITPINDLLNASSAIGCLNIDTVSGMARYYTKFAFRLKGIEYEDVSLFHLPYATLGIRGNVHTENDTLAVEDEDIYKYTYYLKDDLYDARYDPQFSPIIEPGDVLNISVGSDQKQKFTVYCTDCKGKEYSEEFEIEGKQDLNYKLPEGINLVINRVGIRAKYPYMIRDINIKRNPKLHYDFREYPIDHYGPRYEGDFMNNIRGFVKHSGDWTIDEGLKGQCSEHALISSGNYGNSYDYISWSFIPRKGKRHLLVFNMKGYLDYEAIGFDNDKLVLLRKDKEEKIIESYPFEWELNKHYQLSLKRDDKGMTVKIADKEFYFKDVKMGDLFGFYLGEDSESVTEELIIG